MKLIVGLGNPGKKYQHNRHNAGHQFIDYMVKWLNGSQAENKQNKNQSNHKEIKLLKSSVFMNQSGEEVKKYITRYKLHVTSDLIIAHDDLDIPLGDFKIQMANGPKLHNGIRSIEETFGTKDFLRIRIGVDKRIQDNWINGERYVLSDFSLDEYSILRQTFPKILKRLEQEFFH